MADLIDRQAAIDALCSVCGNDCDKTEFVYDAPQWDQVIMCPEHYVLTTLPSAQPEIIRCKYCKWWSDDEYRECSSPNYDNVHVTPAGFYCGYAERRTNG